MTEFKELLKQDVTKESGLSEQEEYFLDILFDRCGGDIKMAMNDAGYPKDASAMKLQTKLSKEIIKRSKEFLAGHTAKAAVSLMGVFSDPSAMGAKNIISAAKEVLDRGGVNKEEKTFELPDNAIVILPPKNRNDDWNKSITSWTLEGLL